MTETADHHKVREDVDFAPIREKLAEIKRRRDALPAGKAMRHERSALNRQIRKLEETLGQFSES